VKEERRERSRKGGRERKGEMGAGKGRYG